MAIVRMAVLQMPKFSRLIFLSQFFLVGIFVISAPVLAFAQTYGGGTYGGGLYNVGDSPVVQSGGGGGGGSYSSAVSGAVAQAPATPPASQTLPSVCNQGDVFNILTGARCSGSASSTVVSVPVASAWVFTQNLPPSSRGAQVKLLQQFLNAQGFTIAASGPGSSGKETTVFGPFTQAALIKFQQANNIIPANGRLGPATRAKINGL